MAAVALDSPSSDLVPFSVRNLKNLTAIKELRKGHAIHQIEASYLHYFSEVKNMEMDNCL